MSSTLMTTVVSAQELDSLDALRWERRVILAFVTPATRDETRAALEAAEEGLQDREVTWLLIEAGHPPVSNHADGVSPRLASQLAAGLAPVAEPLDVVLIGKDGGVKSRGETLDLEALFDQVDGMPMRRQELREREAAVEQDSSS